MVLAEMLLHLKKEVKAASCGVLSCDRLHCASTTQAYFGGGTKLTVLGKIHTFWSKC